MDTRRSRSTVDAPQNSPNKDGVKDIVEKQGNSSPEQESVSDSVDSNVVEASDSPSPNKEKKGMITRSIGKSPNKEVESKKENADRRTPSKNKSSPLSDTTGDSPPPKRKKTLDKREEINFIDLSGNDDEASSQDDDDDDDDDSSSGDPLRFEPESKTTFFEKPKVSSTSVVQGGGNMNNSNLPKTGKPPLIKVKRVVKGANEGEINVLTSYEASVGPAKTSPSGEAIPQSAKKYMILDKNTINYMMDKGLVQTIKKDGNNQTIATYRAVVPKGESAILNKLASASVTSLPTVHNNNPVSQIMETSKPTGIPALSTTFKPISVASTSSTAALPIKSMMTILGSPTSVTSATTMNSSGKVFVPSSGGVKINIPPATLTNGKASGVQQVFTTPIYVKTPVTSSAAKQANMQVVTLPPEILQQLQNMQKKTSGASSATSGKPIFTIASGSQQAIKVITKGGTVTTSVSKKYNPVDPDDPPSINISDDSEEEGLAKKKDGAKYSVVPKSTLTGVPAAIVNKTGNPNIRWVAVPNKPGEAKPIGSVPVMSNSVPIRFSTAGGDGGAGNSQTTIPSGLQVIGDELYTHCKIQELKAKQKEQLNYHRKRYSELLQTYNELASKYNEIKDVGTMNQILTDAKKYMKRDHILFFRNEMMLHDRSGTGNRYSPKFMMMLMNYYNRSHIGYRFLRHLFTLPAVRTLITWQNKKLPLRKKKSASKKHLEITVEASQNVAPNTYSRTSGTTSSLQPPPISKITVNDSPSYYDSDSEPLDFEEDSIEINSQEMDKTGVGDGE